MINSYCGATKAAVAILVLVGIGTYKWDATMTIVVDPAYSSAPAEKPRPLIQNVWPAAAVGLGLGLSVVWTFFLGYGLIKLIDLAILEIAG